MNTVVVRSPETVDEDDKGDDACVDGIDTSPLVVPALGVVSGIPVGGSGLQIEIFDGFG
jgi:hypothetical protein